jgi:hypothetical protein
MTSLINPSSIDGAYPVAGQDNSSQGFRDNFTNTKVNFEYAKDEITELQNNAILKAPLYGTTLNNDMMGALIKNAQIQGFTGTAVILGNRSGAVTIDYLAGPYQSITTSGSITLSITNNPQAGIAGVIDISINVTNVAHTVTLPTTTTINNFGIIGLNPITNTITFTTPGVYSFRFLTVNNGYTYSVSQTNQVMVPLNNTSEILDSGSTATLGVTTSYFNLAGNSQAALPAGVEGVTKIFVLSGTTGGTMTITVTNPGWSLNATGLLSLSALGSTCTLRYLNGRWFVISNNGVTVT